MSCALMFDIIFSDKAKKQFLKLEKQIQERIGTALERIKIRPESYVERLTGEPGFKFRIGDNRLILDIQHEKLVILVIKVGHRKNIYTKAF
ncbi:type II toxin-antitoxin system RelE/ParE family toxin [Candidatus Woesearchaeota archaeon]|nr:type II toxin-antitoxin system RelE/ParE family toxin [Candidatus Woesearchaeota archaeon]